jgi:YHS domain-containing protein
MTRIALMALVASFSFTALADGSKVALGGYCPVGYVTANKALPGDLKVTSEVDGKIYSFINEAAKKAFDADPKKFVSAIQYGAWCATGLAMGKKIASDPALFSAVDGKVYLFSSKGAKDVFDKSPRDFISRADAQAKKLATE